jgi:hypothetical protein
MVGTKNVGYKEWSARPQILQQFKTKKYPLSGFRIWHLKNINRLQLERVGELVMRMLK